MRMLAGRLARATGFSDAADRMLAAFPSDEIVDGVVALLSWRPDVDGIGSGDLATCKLYASESDLVCRSLWRLIFMPT